MRRLVAQETGVTWPSECTSSSKRYGIGTEDFRGRAADWPGGKGECRLREGEKPHERGKALDNTNHETGRSRRGAERGAEQVEFAFVVAALMMLLLGIFWFARGYNAHETMTRAAREGARVAAMPSSFAQGNTFLDAAKVTDTSESTVFNQHIAPVLLAGHLSPNEVSNYNQEVTWLNPGDTNQQCGVVISFQYPFHLWIPFTSLRLTTIHLSTRVQMRRENQPSTGTCP
jgi:hypothetical protein